MKRKRVALILCVILLLPLTACGGKGSKAIAYWKADSPRSSAQMAAEAFRGFTVEKYRAYVRAFMSEPVAGFENMTYAEGFYLPMVTLVQYLTEHGFTVFISSGSERSLARELIADTLGEWIPPYRVIGSTFSLEASGQGEKEGRKYTYAPDDQVLLEGNLLQKNQRMNKVITIVDEIGAALIVLSSWLAKRWAKHKKNLEAA